MRLVLGKASGSSIGALLDSIVTIASARQVEIVGQPEVGVATPTT